MEICESFKVPRGTVQGLQDSAGRFAGMIGAFCERLGWSDMEGLVSKFQKRVSFGVKSEIVDLTEIPFVKVRREHAISRIVNIFPQNCASQFFRCTTSNSL